MIKEIKLHEITDNSLDNYSLCFIDNINEMIYVYDETTDFLIYMAVMKNRIQNL